MKFADAWIHGLRRFGGPEPHRVRIDTKLVCLIGANEAGKSTVLRGLEIGATEAAVAASDRTRRETVPDDRQIVRLRYRLEAGDRDALATIRADRDPRECQWFDLYRLANGSTQSQVTPALQRDRAPRQSMLERLRVASDQWWPPAADGAEVENVDAPERDRVVRITKALALNDETLASGIIADLAGLADELDSGHQALASGLRDLAVHEDAATPWRQAMDILMARRPAFVRFDEAARQLESEYDLRQAAGSPGAALSNLAALARLDLPAFLDAILRGETGTVRDLREAANRVLAERFEAWQQQPPVAVVLENEGPILRIHVQSGVGPTMPFHERSDGLRQFVALVALTAQDERPIAPVLLIDEIETHLHYDAQADLVEVLAQQSAAPQVIYTTHSAACLPEDLGLGVRVIEGVDQLTASRIRQNFWRDDHPGMSALLMAMGAASLAYVPLRPALIAEGGSDLVLLPTLMREAIDTDHLDFAIVPGSSSTPPDRIAGLDLQGVRTAWVLDADDGGRRRRDQLVGLGIPLERILMLSDDGDLEVEDLVRPETYCTAVQRYVSDVGGTDTFQLADLPVEACRRHDTLVAWCVARNLHAPGKIAIANNIIDLAVSVPLLDPSRATVLRDLHQRARQLLHPVAHNQPV